MNIPKAIEIGKELEHHSSLAFSPDELDFIRLGIEALKAWGAIRQDLIKPELCRLPGETED